MKRAKLLFPLMFALALVGSAFTLHSSASKKIITIYYEDPMYFTCDAYNVFEGNCFVDPTNYFCYYNTLDWGVQQVFQQNAFGQTCYQPLYSYTDMVYGQ